MKKKKTKLSINKIMNKFRKSYEKQVEQLINDYLDGDTILLKETDYKNLKYNIKTDDQYVQDLLIDTMIKQPNQFYNPKRANKLTKVLYNKGD